MLNITYTVRVLNRAKRRAGTRKNKGIAPRILNLGSKWKSVVKFTPQPL
jgi:hypothetical protein